MKILREYAFWPDEANAEYGLLFVEDEQGKRWTLRSDLALLRMITRDVIKTEPQSADSPQELNAFSPG